MLKVTMQVDRDKLVQKDKEEIDQMRKEDPDMDYIKANEENEETKYLEDLTNIDPQKKKEANSSKALIQEISQKEIIKV